MSFPSWPGSVPAIHVFLASAPFFLLSAVETWMPGRRTGITNHPEKSPALKTDHDRLVQECQRCHGARTCLPATGKAEKYFLVRDVPETKTAPAGGTSPLVPGPSGTSRRGYLRAAQAYMLISMPTCTSTIFGVFQAIGVSSLYWGANPAQQQPKCRSVFAQA